MFSPFIVSAAEEKPLFDVKVEKIVSLEGTNLSLFYFSPKDIQDNSKIDSWKVRFYCDKDMNMKFVDLAKDSCNTAVSFKNSSTLPNIILFQNENDGNKKFTFALKAYDKNGKWLHTKKSNFVWN